MTDEKFSYYPPGSSPRNSPLCGHIAENTSGSPNDDNKCKLPAGHTGPIHSVTADRVAYAEVERTGRSVEVSFRSWYGNRPLRVYNRAEANALLEFLSSTFDKLFLAEETTDS